MKTEMFKRFMIKQTLSLFILQGFCDIFPLRTIWSLAYFMVLACSNWVTFMLHWYLSKLQILIKRNRTYSLTFLQSTASYLGFQLLFNITLKLSRKYLKPIIGFRINQVLFICSIGSCDTFSILHDLNLKFHKLCLRSSPAQDEPALSSIDIYVNFRL